LRTIDIFTLNFLEESAVYLKKLSYGMINSWYTYYQHFNFETHWPYGTTKAAVLHVCTAFYIISHFEMPVIFFTLCRCPFGIVQSVLNVGLWNYVSRVLGQHFESSEVFFMTWLIHKIIKKKTVIVLREFFFCHHNL